MAEDEPNAKRHYLGHRERLRERFLKAADSLPDYEILELLLCLAQPRGDVKPLAKRLIDRFGGFAATISATPEDLAKVRGIGVASIAALKLAREAALRLARAEVSNRPVIGSWQKLVDYCRATMAHAGNEEFWLLFLDRKNALIADELQQRGTVDHTPVYPREVFKRALELHASALIMVHNHPSGDPTPSPADIEMTREVARSPAAVGISLHDHLIVAREGHASLKSLGHL